MNDKNENPSYVSPVSNHYHHYPVNHYNYYYSNSNEVNNTEQTPEYSRNHSVSNQLPPNVPSPPPHFLNNSTAKRNFSGRITSYRNHREFQSSNQSSIVRNRKSGHRSQPNSFSGNSSSSRNSTQRPNSPKQISRNPNPSKSRPTVPGSSSSVQRPRNQTNYENRDKRRLNRNGGRATTIIRINYGGAGSRFLRFRLREIFSDETKFIITDEEMASFTEVTESANKFNGIKCRICSAIDKCTRLPAEDLMNIAKRIIHVTHEYKNPIFISLKRAIEKRMDGVCGNWQGRSVVKKATLFYLLNLIVEAERVNFGDRSARGRHWNRFLEELISSHWHFRMVVETASSDEKQQLYSLRCMWNAYMSDATTEKNDNELDRQDFQTNQRLDKTDHHPYTNLFVNKGQTAVSNNKDDTEEDEENDDLDNYGHFNEEIRQTEVSYNEDDTEEEDGDLDNFGHFNEEIRQTEVSYDEDDTEEEDNHLDNYGHFNEEIRQAEVSYNEDDTEEVDGHLDNFDHINEEIRQTEVSDAEDTRHSEVGESGDERNLGHFSQTIALGQTEVSYTAGTINTEEDENGDEEKTEVYCADKIKTEKEESDVEDKLGPFAQAIGQTAVSFTKDVKHIEEDKNGDVDNLGHFNQTIDQFLKFDWLLEFPISEKDKQRFTEKYSVDKTPGGDYIYIYDKNVDFNMSSFDYNLRNLFPLAEKRQMIDLAKEIFYIEKVFGINKNSLVTELLITRMSKRESGLCLTERWIAVLLIHIVLSAEATQSSSRKLPKKERPFCKAFSTKAFVANFREFVGTIKSRRNRQKMYWMRIVWSSCLFKECLSEIDKNDFWTNLKVRTSAIPTKLILKRPNIVANPHDDDEITVVANIDKNDQPEGVPTIVLLSSEDEGCKSDVPISDAEGSIISIGDSVNKVNNSSVNTEENIPKIASPKKKNNENKAWYKEFQKNRKQLWTAAFSMSNEDIHIMSKKYDFQKDSDLLLTSETKLSLTLEKFRHTVLSMFPLRKRSQLLWAAKEAFFLAENIGEAAIHEIVAFLASGLQEGFDIKPTGVKFISRLAAFFIIHIIISVEGIEPSLLKHINQKLFTNSFLKEDVVKAAEDLSLTIKDDGISRILKFLVLTWVPNGADKFTSRITKLYNSKDDLEAGFLLDIYDYTVAKYKEYIKMIAREIPVASNSSKRKIEETEFSSNDEEGIDCPIYSSAAEIEIGNEEEVNSIRSEPQKTRTSPKRKAVEKEKRDKTKEMLLAKTSENLQEVCSPDKIKTVPSASNEAVKHSIEGSTENKSKRQHNSRTVVSSSATTSSELLGANGKPLQQSGSRCEKNMENIRKMLRKRNGEHKKSKDSDDSVPSLSNSSGIQTQEQIIEVQSQDFVDNLINGNLNFIFTENGIQVKTIHPKLTI